MSAYGNPQHVMIVEDDPSIGQVVSDALTAHGYEVSLYRTGATATQAFEARVPDLVLLDAGLPDIDGFTLCRWFRTSNRDVPIVLVTARDTEIDIVVGLDAGANDYVTKPFSTAVLLARVRAHLRDTRPEDPNGSVQVGTLRVDPTAYQATINGEPVQLRLREFQLLLYLVRAVGKVVPRDRLLADVWDLHWESSTKTVDMHIVSLRRKVGSAVDIATVRGVGYRLVAP